MKMQAVDAAVRILEAEGITCAFGVPGPAINPPPLGIQKARRLAGARWQLMFGAITLMAAALQDELRKLGLRKTLAFGRCCPPP
jgi:hypothetical protein